MKKMCSVEEPKLIGFSLPRHCFCYIIGHLVEVILFQLDLMGSYGLLGFHIERPDSLVSSRWQMRRR